MGWLPAGGVAPAGRTRAPAGSHSALLRVVPPALLRRAITSLASHVVLALNGRSLSLADGFVLGIQYPLVTGRLSGCLGEDEAAVAGRGSSSSRSLITCTLQGSTGRCTGDEPTLSGVGVSSHSRALFFLLPSLGGARATDRDWGNRVTVVHTTACHFAKEGASNLVNYLHLTFYLRLMTSGLVLGYLFVPG